MSSSSGASASSASKKSIADLDPVTRNALRYTISAREYELLHQYLLSKAPALKRRTPRPRRDEHSGPKEHDHNAATVRLTVRLFLATYGGLKLWELIKTKMLRRGERQAVTLGSAPTRSPNLRLAASLSSILLFHRLLYRFFSRLRESLRGQDARPFRRRNPLISRMLTSKSAPAVGASLSGFFLGVSPADQTRITVAIYVGSRALEFLYNSLDNRGYFKSVPWWFGAWILHPLATGQLLHAFVFDRDCFPTSYGEFITNRSPEYIQKRPIDYPSHLEWPGTLKIVDNLAEISRLRWPAFTSPILYPNKTRTLPSTIDSSISAITAPANPIIANLSCAVLHPHDPSCARTYVKYFLSAYPPMVKFFTVVYTFMYALPRWRKFVQTPISAANAFAQRTLRMAFFVTSSIGTAWGSICLLQHVLPRNVLPTSRWFLSGFLGGMWAFLERNSGRDDFVYSARTSMDSLWKVGKKKGWWKGVKSGDVLVFVAALMMIDVVYERDPKAVTGGVLRKGLGVLRGEGWKDRAAVATDGAGEEDVTAEKKEQDEKKEL